MESERSLKWFLITSLILAILLPILLIGVLFTNILTSSIKKNIVAGNEKLTQSFVYQIEEYLDQSLKDLLSLKTMIEKQDFEMVHINSLLESVRQNKANFTQIQVINKLGATRFISPYDPEFVGLDLSNTDFFKKTVATGRPHWSHTFISSQSNQPVVSVSVPYLNGVITGYLSLENLIESARKITRGENIKMTLTDQTSSYIVHYRENMVFERGFDPLYDTFRSSYSGGINTIEVEYEGEPVIATASLIKQTDWVIVFYQSVKTVFAPIRTIYFYMMLIAGVISLTTTILCLKYINAIIRVLDRFSQSAEIVAKGDYTEQIRDIKYKEFSDLAEQFNTMAAAIHTREIALAEKEEKYRSMFTAAQDAIIIIDAETAKILDANEFAGCLYEYELSEFLSLGLADICHEGDDTLVRLAKKKNWHSINSHLKKNGARLPVEVSGSYHRQADGRQICTLVARDITARTEQEKQRRKMEIQLSQARKMEAIGTLAGGIAHDFNNILGAIIGYAELSLSMIPENSKQADNIRHILSAGKRASELVRQILTFARSSTKEKKPVSIKELIKEVHKLIRASIPTFIDIKVRIEDDATVLADPIELHQVLMNLCTNASHAMSDSKGTLTISLETAAEVPEFISGGKAVVSDRYVILSVEDTGHGIQKSDMPKIFDPYFTTKGVGKGSGMGLSVVQGIIQSIDGFIDVKSEPGRGTIFSVYLPMAKTEVYEKAINQPQPKGGRETIMLVDDEEMIVIPITKNLEVLGYRVHSYTDPVKALDAVGKNGQAFDLLITDMTMPKMSGFDLALAVTRIRPGLPIILCTGFLEGVSKEKAREYGIHTFISKPVTLQELSHKVRQALDEQ